MILNIKEIKQNIKIWKHNTTELGTLKWLGHPPNQTNFNDEFILYNNSGKWKAIQINVLESCMLICDNVIDKNNKIVPTTLTYCPYTKTAVGYYGKYEIDDLIYNNNIILKDMNNTQHRVIQLTGKKYSIIDDVSIFNQKFELIRLTTKDILHNFPDVSYLNVSCNFMKPNIPPHLNLLISDKDYNEKVLGLEYVSKNKDMTKKYVMFIYRDYLSLSQNIKNNSAKYAEKGSFMIPTTYAAWIAFHPNTIVFEV